MKKDTNLRFINDLIADNNKKKKKFHLGPYKGVSEVFENDAWFRSFYMEIAKLYGFPVSQLESYTKQDKILSAFASINITLALEEHVSLWHPWWKGQVAITEELAEDFCRSVYEIRGEHLVAIF